MDLYSAESKKIQNLVQEWLNHPEQELETTFGAAGTVDATTFLGIAQRLRAKGYEPLPQDDRLSILTQKNIRFSIQGLGVLQGYCRNDAIQGTPFTAMIKDRTSLESNLDLEEYEMRIKSRREIPLSENDPSVRELLENWTLVKKAYRLIRRWTFKGKGIRIDMSIVRSTPKDSRGDFRWSKGFQDYNIFKQPAIYEVEVELLRDEETSTLETATKSLIRGIGEVLRAIQKNTLLIRKSIRNRVLSEYKELNTTDKFRGVSPITLEKSNMISEIESGVPNIRTGYNVTDKADGLRTLGFCDKKGELFLIDMGMTVYRTGLRNNSCADSLVDGEWVTRNSSGKAINHFLIFDMYIAPGKENVSQLPFANPGKMDEDGRWNRLQKWISAWKQGAEVIAKSITDATRLHVATKQFLFASETDSKAIFTACARVLDTPHIYYTDGLILTPNTLPLPAKSGDTFYEQFKWKPASDNTIDFLVNYEKDPEMVTVDKVITGIHPISGETTRFKTMRLYVGSIKDPAYDDPRTTILNQLPLPNPKLGGKQVYKPVLFNPADFPDTMANTCYRAVEFDTESGEEFVMTEDTNEPIQDRSIVEMRYEPSQDAGWRWIPMRIRHDKTERLLRGTIARTLNSEKVANSVWNSIHDPITVSMIRSGMEEPTEDESKEAQEKGGEDIRRVYYKRTAQENDLKIVRGMRDFHNKYIKETILYASAMLDGGKGRGGKKVIDFACGKAGDLQKWRRGRASFVLGVDTAGDNIRDANNGAYRRYLDSLIRAGRNGREKVPPMVFAIANSTLSLVSGEAGATPEERDILRSIFGRALPEGPVPKAIELVSAGALRSGADVAVCMFALHYFFESVGMLNGFLKNLADTVSVGGYFIGCCFDGQKVFDMLRGVETGEAKVGKEDDVPIWSIRKEYAQDDLIADDESVGLAVDVEFITIGAAHREYLVSFDYLTKRLKEIGFELPTAEEVKEIGLRAATNTFDVSYKMANDSGHKYAMPDSVKEFSFLNRWFIFKRRGLIGTEALPEPVAGEVEVIDAAADATEDNTTRSIVPRADADAEIMENVANEIAEEAAPEPSTGALLPKPDAKFAPAEIFLFGSAVALQDTLKIGDAGAGRWLAPSALFPIRDTEEAGVEYPSMDHYLAGMMMKYAGKNPVLAKTLFSSTGSIHQKFEDTRRLKTGADGKLPDKDYYELIKDEIAAVRKALMPSELRQYRVKIDDALWVEHKDKALREALSQRWNRDARFRKAVSAAREKGKYLLYYIGPSGAGELGGVRRAADGRIEGENKIGRIIMDLAAFRF